MGRWRSLDWRLDAVAGSGRPEEAVVGGRFPHALNGVELGRVGREPEEFDAVWFAASHSRPFSSRLGRGVEADLGGRILDAADDGLVSTRGRDRGNASHPQ